MLIDKDGRVLGKINIIDFLAILLILLLLAFFGTRFLLPRAGEEHISLQLFAAEEALWVAEKIEEKAPLYDREAGKTLGHITAVDIRAGHEGTCSLYLSAEAMGQKTPNGVEIGGNSYAVGQSVLLYAGKAQISARIRDIG